MTRARKGLALLAALLLVGAGVGLAWWTLRPSEQVVQQGRATPAPEGLARHCREVVGPPRVLEPSPGVFVAVGYDLANTILVQTDEGHVVIDAGLAPDTAARTREALLARAPGRVHTLIYTHSHIDHVGGASVWVEEGTQVWASAAFEEHFFKQYGVFQEAERARGARQFGHHASHDALPCSALGARPALDALKRTGARMPTHTFEGKTALTVGGKRFELHEAFGETHDQILVWMPDAKLLMPGDNFYVSYPNLYTLRGTSPRPVRAWIASLDQMRRLAPEHLIPSHTPPLQGAAHIAQTLRDYRDGIQWVRDAVVRGANAGQPLDQIVDGVGLPPHLRQAPALQELYGQLDWSARAIYTNELGWFDGRPTELYKLPARDEADRMMALMGGPPKVWGALLQAQADQDHRWALRLVALLRVGSPSPQVPPKDLDAREAQSLRALADQTSNSNGRAYLLESAHEREHGFELLPRPAMDDALTDAVPLSLFFEAMSGRLLPERSLDAHERVTFVFSDVGRTFHLTVRRGVAEVVEGDPLPDAPPALATLTTDAPTWRRVALKQMAPLDAVTSGRLRVEGDQAGLLRFLQRFRQDD